MTAQNAQIIVDISENNLRSVDDDEPTFFVPELNKHVMLIEMEYNAQIGEWYVTA